ncbi:hypothetical protein AAG570_008758 [Ranatra chinensis]|uniref:Kappa-casein n=1 Tax=Ranatra chinensis TaxID=642074 RepID=A0ABD0YSI0_9HEMI
MASKRRNMFYENKKQETTEIDPPLITMLLERGGCYFLAYPSHLDQFRGQNQGYGLSPEYVYRTPYVEETRPYQPDYYQPAVPQTYALFPGRQQTLFRPFFRAPEPPEVHRPLFVRPFHQPTQIVLVPLRATYSFPRPLERLVERVQTYFSIYNPPEALTVDRPLHTPTTTQIAPQDPVPTTDLPQQLTDTKVTTPSGTEEPNSTDAPSTTTTAKVTTQEAPETTTESLDQETTTATDDGFTTDVQETTTDANNYIPPETESPISS